MLDSELRPIIGEYPQIQPRRTWADLWNNVVSGVGRFLVPEVVTRVGYPGGRQPEVSSAVKVMTPDAIIRPGFRLSPKICNKYGHHGLAELAAAMEYMLITKRAERALPLPLSDDQREFRLLSRALILHDIMPLVEDPEPKIIDHDPAFVDCGSIEYLPPYAAGTQDNSADTSQPTREEQILAAYLDLREILDKASVSWEDSLKLRPMRAKLHSGK